MAPRESDRERDIQGRIEELRKQLLKEALDEDGNNSNVRHIVLYLADVVSILASEYGTAMRIMDRIDSHGKLIEEQQRLIKEGDGSINLHSLYQSARKREKLSWIIITALVGLVVTNLWTINMDRKVLVKEVVINHTNTVYIPKP